jgi:hypothetical protein
MSSFVAFGSRQISLGKRSHSSFALVVSFLCVGKEFPPPPAMPMRNVSGRSRLMRAVFSTGTRRCRSSEESTLF